MKPLHYSTAPGDYSSDPRPDSIGHISDSEISVHLQKRVLRHASMPDRANQQTMEGIPFTPPAQSQRQ